MCWLRCLCWAPCSLEPGYAGVSVVTGTVGYLSNAIAFLAMKWQLPGVFEHNTLSAVNGSLWTLTVEVRCYLALAIVGALLLRFNRTASNVVLLLILLWGCFSLQVSLAGR